MNLPLWLARPVQSVLLPLAVLGLTAVVAAFATGVPLLTGHGQQSPVPIEPINIGWLTAALGVLLAGGMKAWEVYRRTKREDSAHAQATQTVTVGAEARADRAESRAEGRDIGTILERLSAMAMRFQVIADGLDVVAKERLLVLQEMRDSMRQRRDLTELLGRLALTADLIVQDHEAVKRLLTDISNRTPPGGSP